MKITFRERLGIGVTYFDVDIPRDMIGTLTVQNEDRDEFVDSLKACDIEIVIYEREGIEKPQSEITEAQVA